MKPNEARKLVTVVSNMLNKKVKLEILNNKKDGSFTVKMVHGARILNVEKNSLGEYFVKYYPFLDMSENHNWAVRNSKYATFFTPTCVKITNLPFFGWQANEYITRHNLGDYVNNENTIGVFMLQDFTIEDFVKLLALTVIAHCEQFAERAKFYHAWKEEENATKKKHRQPRLKIKLVPEY